MHQLGSILQNASSGLLTCAIVEGIEYGKESADYKDVSILVKHFGGL
jgi:hypothetical protein